MRPSVEQELLRGIKSFVSALVGGFPQYPSSHCRSTESADDENLPDPLCTGNLWATRNVSNNYFCSVLHQAHRKIPPVIILVAPTFHTWDL